MLKGLAVHNSNKMLEHSVDNLYEIKWFLWSVQSTDYTWAFQIAEHISGTTLLSKILLVMSFKRET